jgi:Mg-chelatase subunit ChlD/flagellar basal body-associated protein FliL
MPTLGTLFRPAAQNTWDESATPSAPARALIEKLGKETASPARGREGQAATQIAELRPETSPAKRPADSEILRELSLPGGGQRGAAAVDRAGLAASAGVGVGGNAASNRAVNRGEAGQLGNAGGDQLAVADFDAADKLSLSVDDRKSSSLEAGEEKARVPLKKVVVNVAGTQGSRAWVENITLEGEGKKFNKLITDQQDQLTDLASSVLAGKTLSDLEQPGARQAIRTELLSAFNNALGSDLVNEIHFTEPPETVQQESKNSLHEGLDSLAQEKDKVDGNTGLPLITSGAGEAGEKADIAGRTSYSAMSPRMAKRYGLMPAAPPAAPATPAPAVVSKPTPPAARPAAPPPPAESESVAQAAKPRGPAPVPQPEVRTVENTFSTFSLNVADVSFKLAASSLEQNTMPDPATVRSEEFINAFQYRDPEPTPGTAIGFAWERSRYPFAHDRDLLRLSLRTASQGRAAERALNVVLLLDSSGSMERADRVRIIQECLRVLAAQLKPADRISVITFSRSAHLLFDGLAGNQAGQIPGRVSQLAPQGGTNLEDALGLAYATARRHFLEQGINRVVLLTDGAANLGNVDPQALKSKVESQRRAGIALDCFGIGWEGYNDDLLEVLSRNGDGRYGFVNDPAEAASGFAAQLAGALRVAASDVKVQVEFNAKRVPAYRQIGYAKHQLKKEQFRDNTVDAAELGAAETGHALYVIQVNPQGEGPMGVVRVRFKVPGTSEYRETERTVNYHGASLPLEQASAAMRLAATASAFSEWLVASPFASEVTADRLLQLLNGTPAAFEPDPKPKRLEWMIRQAKSLAGR